MLSYSNQATKTNSSIAHSQVQRAADLPTTTFRDEPQVDNLVPNLDIHEMAAMFAEVFLRNFCETTWNPYTEIQIDGLAHTTWSVQNSSDSPPLVVSQHLLPN